MAAVPIAIDSADDPRIAEFRDIRERDLTGRENRFIAEGTVVLRMLAEAHAQSRGFFAEKILLLRNRVDGVLPILERFPADVPVYVAEAGVLDGVVGFHLHRGVLALGRREARGEAALLGALPERALVLVGCGISNHDNAGSMFRNAAAFRADAVLLDETCCDPLYRKALRVSVGSVLSVPHRRGGKALDVLLSLAERGFAIWTLSPHGKIDIRAIPASTRMALVIGTEGAGLPEALLARFQSAHIPQSEELDSLNAATATGIALFSMASAMGRI
ncbi:RNA methyltransferase [Rhizobium leguminosarum bv. trifolii CB782]|uniref:RNA methyltransferase n=1 Tax=Rhizobium hidalgonense TaxID=1538159 RepID=A0A2A6KF95_9HYPH|nr:RNA methyltransferase [Rhizobium hidalgonense]AHG46607.1 RNA methyltransferase [Rhizobium leguminosarum bv. trifolii CB782]EJC77538.1 rRNA methylase [Rhizobium leguminosarum bv. trifolii WSM2012]MDR9773645.1 RNA methyltransferase [Rhizobium hidalgonense]MDR9807382.1 RNA methyltransferase [Rhizobium hidalgonense]MDR9811050.1 RNA methyltransferase [Rhizobium hidalgonense]